MFAESFGDEKQFAWSEQHVGLGGTNPGHLHRRKLMQLIHEFCVWEDYTNGLLLSLDEQLEPEIAWVEIPLGYECGGIAGRRPGDTSIQRKENFDFRTFYTFLHKL